jgi:cytochrome P450
MNPSLFLHSDTPDPYPVYQQKRKDSPIYWDDVLKSWVLYSFRDCKAILFDPAALIPALPAAGLSEEVLAIRTKLVRLSNPPDHLSTRQSTATLFHRMSCPTVASVLDPLLPRGGGRVLPEGGSFDWVARIAKVLPASYILTGFGFSPGDKEFIITRIPLLTKIMQVSIHADEAAAIHHDCLEVCKRIERHLPAPDSAAIILGLLIQSHDAGRGLLSNALLWLLRDLQNLRDPRNLRNLRNPPSDKSFYRSFVTEVLRFDPPVHHTRRVAGEDIYLDHHIFKKEQAMVKKGQSIVIMLASANRDERQFADPDILDIHRSNNSDHLTFGYGAHSCLAATFSVRLAAETLVHLVHSYKDIRLEEKEIKYEALANVRLPKQVHINCC